MYTSVIILIIIYTIILLHVYIKYNLDAKDIYDYNEIYREKLNISASEAAYLIDKDCDSLNIILADILTLIEKRYIKMTIVGEGEERDYIFTKLDNSDNVNIKNHEMSSYRLFFKDKNEVSIKEYLMNLKNNSEYLAELELSIPSIKNEIEFELRRQNITDTNAEKKLFKLNKGSISLIIIFIVCTVVTLFSGNAEILEFSFVGLLFSILFYRTTTIKENKLTTYGVQVKKQAEGFKNYLKENSILEDKPLYMVNVLDYNYTMAVAFGLAKLGESEFVHNTYRNIKIKNFFINLIFICIIAAIILINLL